VRAAQVIGLFVRELPALAVIVIGSVGMVYTAVLLAGRYGVPRPLVGLLILATMTSLPNASPRSGSGSPAAARRSSPRP